MRKWILGLVLALVLLPLAAQAQPLSITLSPDTLAGPTGSTLIFQGTLRNNGTSDAFLNDLLFAPSPPIGSFLLADTTVFFSNVPGVLLPDEEYVGPLFGIQIEPGTPSGFYAVQVTFLGGADEFAFDPIGLATLTVQVAPEPATFSLLLLGGAAAGTLRRRRRQRSNRTIPAAGSVR